jgi:hypothetical protein
MFTRKTPLSEFIVSLEEKKACEESIVWAKKINKNNITFGEAIDALVEDGELDQGWAKTVLELWDGELDKEVKKTFLKKITDPMMAFDLYRKLVNIDSEEIDIIKQKFNGKLPTAEKELKDGILTSIR